jgi:hypothetical protein
MGDHAPDPRLAKWPEPYRRAYLEELDRLEASRTG